MMSAVRISESEADKCKSIPYSSDINNTVIEEREEEEVFPGDSISQVNHVLHFDRNLALSKMTKMMEQVQPTIHRPSKKEEKKKDKNFDKIDKNFHIMDKEFAKLNTNLIQLDESIQGIKMHLSNCLTRESCNIFVTQDTLRQFITKSQIEDLIRMKIENIRQCSHEDTASERYEFGEQIVRSQNKVIDLTSIVGELEDKVIELSRVGAELKESEKLSRQFESRVSILEHRKFVLRVEHLPIVAVLLLFFGWAMGVGFYRTFETAVVAQASFTKKQYHS
jgi:hypothetical protein